MMLGAFGQVVMVLCILGGALTVRTYKQRMAYAEDAQRFAVADARRGSTTMRRPVEATVLSGPKKRGLGMKVSYSKRRDRYESVQKRGFRAALIRLLETEYKIIGSHRVLATLADDIEQLQREIAAQHGFELIDHSLVLYVRPKTS